MPCDNTKKSLGSFERLGKAWNEKVDRAFTWMHDKLQKLDKNGVIVATKMQHDLSDMLNHFRAAKNDIYKAADTVKQFLDTFSKDESADIVRALNGDKPHSELSGKVLEAYKRLRALIDHNADELVKAGVLDSKNKIADYLKRYYQSHLNDLGMLAKMLHDRKFSRKDLTYEERIALGMIEDASYVVPRTLAEQRIQLLKAQFLEKIRDTFASDTEKVGYEKVAKIDMGGGVLKYGALSGKWIPKEIKAMLDSAHLLKEELGIAEKYLFPVIDHIKVNLTVKNPVTHIYNILANMQTAAIQGTLGNVAKILHMMKHDKPKFDALLDELAPFGLDSMLKDMESVTLFSNNKGVNIFASIVQNMYMTEHSKVGKKIRDVYDWEDKLFKVAAYDKMKSEAEAHLGRKLTDAERLAAYKEAVAPYANYSTPLPAVFKLLDKTGISPFLHYLYKSTPAVAKLIAKHPLKYAMIQVALLGTGASIWSENDDVLKPDWAGTDSKVNLFGAKDWVRFDNGWYWNAGRMMPALKMGAVDLSGGILGGTIRLVNGETPLGYTIGSKYDGVATKTWERIAALAENYAPPLTFGRYGQRVTKKLAGQEPMNYYKEPMSWTEMGTRALGVRHFNESAEVKKKVNAANNRLKYLIENDPDNKDRHEKEHAESLQEIERQARAHGVDMPAPKGGFKKNFVEPIVSKQLVKL